MNFPSKLVVVTQTSMEKDHNRLEMGTDRPNFRDWLGLGQSQAQSGPGSGQGMARFRSRNLFGPKRFPFQSFRLHHDSYQSKLNVINIGSDKIKTRPRWERVFHTQKTNPATVSTIPMIFKTSKFKCRRCTRRLAATLASVQSLCSPSHKSTPSHDPHIPYQGISIDFNFSSVSLFFLRFVISLNSRSQCLLQPLSISVLPAITK